MADSLPRQFECSQPFGLPPLCPSLYGKLDVLLDGKVLEGRIHAADAINGWAATYLERDGKLVLENGEVITTIHTGKVEIVREGRGGSDL